MQSYSRLTAYEDCPYGYYLTYLAGDRTNYGDDNYWAEVGTVVHEILKRIAEGELDPDDAPAEFIENYDEDVVETAKESIMEAVFDDCANFFAEYGYDYLDNYEVVSAEEHFEFCVGKVQMHGFIDLLLKDEDGNFIVMDYKSCKPFFGKKGQLLKSMQKKYEGYLKQMMLYCMAVKQRYGKYPVKVMWLHFRDQTVTELTVTKKDIEAAQRWVVDTVNAIAKDEKFEPKKEYFFCTNLCGHRRTCEYKMYSDEEEE